MVGLDGSVSENGQESNQKIRIVMPDDLSNLQSIGGGNFKIKPTAGEIAEVEEPVVQQKHLEQSNVSAIEQMTRMIQVMRSHEANHRIIQQHDQRLGKMISELGQPV